MRQIGHLDNEQHARLLVDYLLTQGISAQLDHDAGRVGIWVRDENQIEPARKLFEEFAANPQNDRFHAAVDHAAEIRQGQIRRAAEARTRQVTMRRIWAQPLSRRAPLAMVLIALCTFASLATEFGARSRDDVFNAFTFADLRTYQVQGDALQQIKSGQVWRLVTPIFLHASLPHLVFNLMWLYALAPQIEIRRGTVFLGLLTLCSALFSNGLQFAVVRTPAFLGISGVVYAYFGYIWMSLRLQPRSGFFLGESTVFLMLFALVLGFTGALDGMIGHGGVANWCHAGGMLTGIAFAWFHAQS